jgi:hypothetical protein
LRSRDSAIWRGFGTAYTVVSRVIKSAKAWGCMVAGVENIFIGRYESMMVLSELFEVLSEV